MVFNHVFQLEFRKIYSQLTNEALDEMAKYFDSDIYSDITIVASDGKEIRAHRNIIATRSPVFERKHLSQMLESRTNQILVEDIDHQTMYEVLRFLYTRKVQNIETLVSNLMYAAEKYDISDLKSICVSAMISQLSINNALKTLVLADRYNEKQLLTETMEFIERYVPLDFSVLHYLFLIIVFKEF
jgi:speckle-type POZ protein